MKINIAFQLKDGPWGGGNQFLKALRDSLVKAGHYEQDPAKADILLINSYQYLLPAAEIKRRYPDKIIVHRIDGPIRIYNAMNDLRDSVIYTTNRLLADATVFQSSWSRDENKRLGLKKQTYEAVIPNAPNPVFFNSAGKSERPGSPKIRLVSTGWSTNPNKGFDILEKLDRTLDADQFEFTYIGNTPIPFKKIRHRPAVPSSELAQYLKQHDIFVFTSRIEACSNSLLEALHCGLPTIAVHSSSNPDLVGQAGHTFHDPADVFPLAKKIALDYRQYQRQISVPSLEQVTEKYLDLFESIQTDIAQRKYTPRAFSALDFAKMKAAILRWKLSERIRSKTAQIKTRILAKMKT